MKMTKEELQYERKIVIKMFKTGYKTNEILEIVELKRRAVTQLISDFKKHGESVVKLKKWGRKVGEQRIL